MISSSHHHQRFFLCIFLLSILSSNSQSPYFFIVYIENQTPSPVATRCYVYGLYRGESLIKPRAIDNFFESIIPGINNTLFCALRLENKYGFFKLFDLNDVSMCYMTTGIYYCNWKIREEGLCILSEGNCVMFKWNNTTLSQIKHIESHEHIIWKQTP